MDYCKNTNIKNKGIGAGGSNTNKNGLLYEELTDLNDCVTIIKKDVFSSTIKFNNNENRQTQNRNTIMNNVLIGFVLLKKLAITAIFYTFVR